MRRLLLILLLLPLGCAVAPPVRGNVTPDPQTPQQCSTYCEGMGLGLSSVVIIANMTGCVCEVRSSAGAPQPAASAAAVSAGVIALQQEEQQQQAAAATTSP